MLRPGCGAFRPTLAIQLHWQRPLHGRGMLCPYERPNIAQFIFIDIIDFSEILE